MQSKRKIWYPYLEPPQIGVAQPEQEFKSEKTSRKQIPRTAHILKLTNLIHKNTVMLDLGCGKFRELMNDYVRNLGGVYHGIDPYNVTKSENIKAINACAGGHTDVVTVSNVLNVIKEEHIQSQIISQAHDALRIGGTLIVVIYEGVKNKREKQQEKETGIKKPLTPIVTRDGFQQRKETSEYLPVIKEHFPSAKIKTFSKNGGKAIIAIK